MKKVTRIEIVETRWDSGKRVNPEATVNAVLEDMDATVLSAGVIMDNDGDTVHWIAVGFHDE